ncbi:MAG: hypothetical protein HYV33_02565 [Candidatus Kerfeldbacteria bacterium]|nr:hypothetical protein [Candidatus Kerfeldbacteria bacterium]
MNQSKPILISTLAASLLLLVGAGCTQPTTNQNNTNTSNVNAVVVVNTNTVVANENTNTTNTNSEVDTSDWLTYTNEEYGFEFRYPREWIVNDQQKNVSLYSPKLVGSTYANSLTIEITANDFVSQKKQVEDSDLINGNLSLSKFNNDIEELDINGLTAKVGTHSTAIGLDERYYFISLSNDVGLYFEFLKPTEKVNASIEDVIHTLEIL